MAAPSAGMALGQLGADVIRVDPPGGGSDAGRWPLSRTGASLFWANLNKGKRSVTIDHRQAEGRELLIELVVASGDDGGIFLDNMVGREAASLRGARRTTSRRHPCPRRGTPQRQAGRRLLDQRRGRRAADDRSR